MSVTSLDEAQRVVRIVAETAMANETYFGELDAVVGDGDFGYSLARGFGKLLEDWDTLEYDDVAGLLRRCAMVISGRVGGASGPIWGTAFLRAGASLKDTPDPRGEDVVAALRSSIEGIKQRGGSDLGDKTLIDALVPAVDRLEQELTAGAGTQAALAASAQTARSAAEGTRGMLARRGRAAYAGERSRPSVDAGAVAVAVMFEAVSEAWSATSD
ncbi:dihydroxyacetone kinase subunit DhaL [Conexibacter woesei]|uniref:Dihydroxyacetone kinase, L subunit n=1 Tax=Conexibacter woesei (strain DSM 14684 / CCUG 47730 / CIP 108061 / JCM 11494 / NBRC 100937 / ID131577) TaxID=469383 RepID=D3FD32_CONWI|nr:dihydroxyacetone kinase subunit DhaL [Conexibacter woesei]ADB51544.1 dihydroxyacetone kinase, L subunit [Conexibacter woesei DSM 14684]